MEQFNSSDETLDRRGYNGNKLPHIDQSVSDNTQTNSLHHLCQGSTEGWSSRRRSSKSMLPTRSCGTPSLWRTVSSNVSVSKKNSSLTLRSIRFKLVDTKIPTRHHHFHSVPALLSSAAADEDEHCCHHSLDNTDTVNSFGEFNKSHTTSSVEIQDKENQFRPVYFIQPNHHVFGCMYYEEDDPDEFFISSGCVRASCPNIYEVTTKASNSHGWQSCAELEYLVNDTGQINSYQIDDYEMKVRNARPPRRNSEVSSTTTTTTMSPSNELVFADQCGKHGCQHHRSMVVGLPPLRLPYSTNEEDNQMTQREKALSLIALAKSYGNNVERGWRKHKLGRMRRWNQPLRSLDTCNFQWKSDTGSPA